MKTILIPIDMSAVAENAFAYAVDFALQQPEKVQLLLLHVFDTTLTSPVTSIDLIARNLEEEERSAKESLTALAAKYAHATGLSCSVLVTRGFLDDEIAGIAALHKADYIFMGTKGATGLKALLFGRNTAQVITKASCPVLAIPENAIFAAPKHIVFASDFQDTDAEDFVGITKMARLFNATIVLLHLSEKQEEELDLRVLDFARSQLESKTGFNRIKTRSLYASSFAEGLEEELRSHSASLLVMAPHKHSYLENLLGRSRTRQMVLRTQWPMLALPTNRSQSSSEKPAQTSTLEQATID